MTMTKMTRYECELKILELANQIRDVYKEYNPAPGFLRLIIDGGYISARDCYFTDINGARDIVEDWQGLMFHTIDATQYADGAIRAKGTRRHNNGESV